jgi:hypothetical protein
MIRRTFCVILAAGLLAFGAWGDEAAGLSGKYKYAPEQSGDISQAIEQAIEKMNFIKRPIARGRLSRTNFAYQQVRIEIGASEAEVTYDTQAPIRMPLDGQAIKWKRADGETFDVSAKLEGARLVQTYKAEDGTRVNSFAKDAAGSLQLQVEVSSPQLPQPLKYTLMYRPAS